MATHRSSRRAPGGGEPRRNSETTKLRAALRASESRYRRLLASLRIGVFRISADDRGVFLEASSETAEILGCDSAAELVGRPLGGLLASPQDRAGSATDLLAGAGGEARSREIEMLRADGRRVWVSVTCLAEPGAEGRIAAIDGIMQDVTVRRQAEQALRESDARLSGLLRSLPVGVYRTTGGPEGRFLEANPAMAEILGYGSAAELMAVPVCALYADPAERGRAVEFTAHRAGRFSTKELQLRRRDGSSIWVAVTSRAELDAAGGVRWLEGVLQDITERRRSEEALRRGESRYRELVQSVNSIILRRDVAGRITFANEFALKFFGYSEEELLGRNMVGTILPATESTGRDLAAMARDIGMHPERYALNENENMRRGGERVWVAWTNKPVRDEAGRVVEILAVGSDMTERRRAESERRRLESQLRQADKMQAVGELAGGIAHDFNNHLAAIMGCAEMLAKRLEGDPAARYAQMTAKAASRAADLTEQLLAYARRGRCREVRVDMHAVVDEVIGLLEHSIDRRIRLGRDLRADRAEVLGDPAQLHNALLNIAVNARDAMPDGGEMTFATELRTLTEERCRQLPYEMRPGAYLAVSVRDTGAGMSEDVRRRLFQPFFTTKPTGRGTGMGLAAVYGTVKSHRGAIEVESDPGAGSTFTLCLPLAPEAPRQDEVQSRAPEAAGQPAGAGASVLLVEDDEMVRETVAGNLRELGCRVTVCADGAEAVRIYRKSWGQIDLVLMDMLMPEIGGREAFLAMRQVNPEVRAVFMSGYVTGEDRASPLADGAVSFLRKPFTSEELSAALSAALDAG